MVRQCEVRTQEGSVRFELLPKDIDDQTWTRCTKLATTLIDWKNGRTTWMCDRHDRQSRL